MKFSELLEMRRVIEQRWNWNCHVTGYEREITGLQQWGSTIRSCDYIAKCFSLSYFSPQDLSTPITCVGRPTQRRGVGPGQTRTKLEVGRGVFVQSR
jgi:hypothetical protein